MKTLKTARKGDSVLLKNASGVKRAWVASTKKIGGKLHIFVTHANADGGLITEEWGAPG